MSKDKHNNRNTFILNKVLWHVYSRLHLSSTCHGKIHSTASGVRPPTWIVTQNTKRLHKTALTKNKQENKEVYTTSILKGYFIEMTIFQRILRTKWRIETLFYCLHVCTFDCSFQGQMRFASWAKLFDSWVYMLNAWLHCLSYARMHLKDKDFLIVISVNATFLNLSLYSVPTGHSARTTNRKLLTRSTQGRVTLLHFGLHAVWKNMCSCGRKTNHCESIIQSLK